MLNKRDNPFIFQANMKLYHGQNASIFVLCYKYYISKRIISLIMHLWFTSDNHETLLIIQMFIVFVSSINSVDLSNKNS